MESCELSIHTTQRTKIGCIKKNRQLYYVVIVSINRVMYDSFDSRERSAFLVLSYSHHTELTVMCRITSPEKVSYE